LSNENFGPQNFRVNQFGPPFYKIAK